MAYSLTPIPPHLVRSALTLEEAYAVLEAADPRSPACDFNDAVDIRMVARRWLAANVLHDAPSCYVWSPSSGWHRIPRDYWWKPGRTMDELVNRVGLNPSFDYADTVDAPGDLYGQEVVVWREAIERLLAANLTPKFSQAAAVNISAKAAISPPLRNDNVFGRLSSYAEIVAWYQNRKAGAPADGYTRDEDIAAGKAVGISRDRVRELRKEYAPQEWQRRGRPAGK